MITAKEIVGEIDEALKRYGKYSYRDKGAREVMDIPDIYNRLKDMSHSEILSVLKEVETTHKDAYPFLTDIIYCFDGDEGVDDLFDSELFQKYY